MQGLPVLHDKRVKVFKNGEIVEVWEKITKNLDFVENSNFIRGSTEGAVRSWSGV